MKAGKTGLICLMERPRVWTLRASFVIFAIFTILIGAEDICFHMRVDTPIQFCFHWPCAIFHGWRYGSKSFKNVVPYQS